MRELALLFVDIARLRRGPQDVPGSGFLLGLLLVLNLATGVVVGASSLGWQDLVWQLLVETLVLFGFVQVLLRVRGKPERFYQTVSAVLGSGIVVSLVSWPVLLWLSAVSSGSPGAMVPSLLWLLVLTWSIIIQGHILHHALEIARGWAVMLSIGWIWLVLGVLQLLGSLFATPGGV